MTLLATQRRLQVCIIVILCQFGAPLGAESDKYETPPVKSAADALPQSNILKVDDTVINDGCSHD